VIPLALQVQTSGSGAVDNRCALWVAEQQNFLYGSALVWTIKMMKKTGTCTSTELRYSITTNGCNWHDISFVPFLN